MIWSSSLPGDIWWVWRSWLARQIVVLEIVGSSPITHPFFMQTYSLRAVNLMGYRQAVKAQHFDCCIVGSIPTSPVYGTLAQMVEHLTFNQVVGGSSPPCLIFLIFFFLFSAAAQFYCAVALCVQAMHIHFCSYGGIGRRGRFRFCWDSRAGSNPVSCIIFFIKRPSEVYPRTAF